MTAKWTGTTEERYERLEQANRRCDGNNRRCTHSAVQQYTLSPAVEWVPTGEPEVIKNSCSRHVQQFTNNPNYVVADTRRFASRPAGASHPHTNYVEHQRARGSRTDRRWETLAHEWVTVLDEPDADDTVTVRYRDGTMTRVGQWILTRIEE
jgi:hypothetical protein